MYPLMKTKKKKIWDTYIIEDHKVDKIMLYVLTRAKFKYVILRRNSGWIIEYIKQYKLLTNAKHVCDSKKCTRID